jgi:hypothetical protein
VIITRNSSDFFQKFLLDWQCIIAFFVAVPFWVSVNFKKFIAIFA